MVDLKMQHPQVSAGQMALVRNFAGALLLLVAAWLGWHGMELMRDEASRTDVVLTRDNAAGAIAANLRADAKRMDAQLRVPAFRGAIDVGNFTEAARLLTDGWPGATRAAVLHPDLDRAYAALPDGSFGRLVALEEALLADAPRVWIVRSGAEPELSLAAPVRSGTQLVAVAVVRLPLARVTAPLQNANLPAGSYVALRQQAFSAFERGEAALAGGAETLAIKIPGSELRIAAAVPEVAPGPFGLDGLLCVIAAAIAGIVGLALLVLPRLRARRGTVDDADFDMPFVDVKPLEPAPVIAPPVPVAPATEPPPLPLEVVGAATIGGVMLDRSIFRAYDIRGVVGRDLDAGVAELIGHAIGTVMHERGQTEVVVGRDGRLSGPSLADGLIAGLRRAGRNVIDIGMAPTPVIYFGAYHLRAGSCVAVTGSHNPPDYNGFKIVVGGETLYGDAITDLFARIAEDRLHVADAPGELSARDIGPAYIERISSEVQIDRPLKVVVDAGNGVAGEIGPAVLRAIGAEVTPLYCDIDGTFPNHHPDPSDPHNLIDLIRMVERLDADLGVAFDGDGDRLGVVTRDGLNIFPDRLLMLFAADVLERNPGAQIIFDVKCTGRLPGHILRHGGSPLMWKTGHSFIKAKMRETDAELAGEMSGHFFFKERWYGFDDGIYAAARLLEILAAAPGTPTQTLNALPNGISTPELKIEAPAGNPHAFVQRFRDEAKFEGARLSTIDGLRVDWPDGWGLVRASNTTPVLVMRFDADTAEGMKRIQDAFRTQLLRLQADLKLPF